MNTRTRTIAWAIALAPLLSFAAPPEGLLPPGPLSIPSENLAAKSSPSPASVPAPAPAASAAQVPASAPRAKPSRIDREASSRRAPLPAPAPVVVRGETDLASEKFFTNPNPSLSAQEQAALAIARKWQEGGTSPMMPIAGSDGTVRFAYGASQPSIVCAVLQVCDVELQPGEQVNSLQIGDQVRWTIEPAISGSGAGEVIHLIIKPQDVGLETSLVVTTNRRTYHLRLRSHRSDFMPRVAFSYPEEAMAKWDAMRNREVKERRDATIPSTGEYLGDLSFDYTLSGSAPWKPVRVYNDGRKTILQMPSTMSQSEAPVLLVVRKDGGIFTEEETGVVNYRVQGNRYIVDALFDKAILIAGVGSAQDRVTIQRGK
ncbi:P-type conjugative transfer protein TrbG [Variovorax sp. CAN2819]|uniref:P-type conjugative transfer protein TrbG n=1 Tax=Variovorax sp. CAN15 TaxID=3046727 RepID=UPI002649217E|nr:P-type conjugative transfer protein TrbG [Variovorax sp. CAN15]MDN6888377.1 P-type conjugative transfer protein TrbG [Variovorax sp. CAN15]